MFVYEKDGGLCILMTGNKPLVEGTPDVEILPVEGEDGVITASVKINGVEVSVASAEAGSDEGTEGTEDAGAEEGTDEGDGPEL